MGKKRLIIIIAIGLLILAMGLFRYMGEDVPIQSQALTRTVMVRKGEMAETIFLDGKVEASQIANLRAQISGEVAKIHVYEGQKVNQGDLLVELDTRDVEHQIAQAEANLQIVRSQLEQTVAKVEVDKMQAQASLQQAQANLAAANSRLIQLKAGPKEQELEQARAALRQAEANWQGAQKDLDRIESLFEQNAATKQELESRQLAVTNAWENYVGNQQKLNLLLSGPAPEELESAQASLRQAESMLLVAQSDLARNKVRDEDIAIAKGRVGEAQANLTVLQGELAALKRSAPISGMVTSLSVVETDLVSPGNILATISNLDQVKVVVSVDEIDLAKVAVGQKGTVIVDAYQDQRYVGEVVHIAPSGKQEGGITTFATTLLLTNKGDRLRPNMTAELELVINEIDDALLVPVDAVKYTEGRPVVLIREGDELVEKRVQIGLSNGRFTQILDGLEEGQRVIISMASPTATTSTTTIQPTTNSLVPVPSGGVGMGSGSGGGRH